MDLTKKKISKIIKNKKQSRRKINPANKDKQHKKKNKYSARNKKRFNLKNKTLKSRRKKGGARGYKPGVDPIKEEEQSDVDEESQDAPQQQEQSIEQRQPETPIIKQPMGEPPVEDTSEPVIVERTPDVAKSSTSRFGKLFRRQDNTQGEKSRGFMSSIKTPFGKKTLDQEPPMIEPAMETSNEVIPITPSISEVLPIDDVRTIERKINEYNIKINILNARKNIIETEIQDAKDIIVASKQKKDQETSEEELSSLNKIIDENNEILNKKQEVFEIILNDIENANRELIQEEDKLRIANQIELPQEEPLQPARQEQEQEQEQTPEPLQEEPQLATQELIQEEELKQIDDEKYGQDVEEKEEEKEMPSPNNIEDVYTTMTTDDDEFYKTIKVIIKIPKKSNVNVINNAGDSVDSYLQQIA